MSYDEEELEESKGFKINLDDDGEVGDEDLMEPLADTDFGLEEEDPDHDH